MRVTSEPVTFTIHLRDTMMVHSTGQVVLEQFRSGFSASVVYSTGQEVLEQFRSGFSASVVYSTESGSATRESQ